MSSSSRVWRELTMVIVHGNLSRPSLPGEDRAIQDLDGRDGSRATLETVPIAKFKATCLALLEKVRRTGQPIVVTRRGQPIAEIVPCSSRSTGHAWLGSFASTGRIVGDIVAPAADQDWEVLTPRREAAS